MKALYSSKLSELVENFNKFEADKNVQSILILMTDDVEFSPDLVEPILKKVTKPILGGVFHEIIFNSKVKSNGVLLLPLSFKLKTKVIDFENDSDSLLEILDEKYSLNLPSSGSIFVFTDAFVYGKNAFVEGLYNFFGNDFNFIGAGCGTYSFQSKKCVVDNNGMYANAAVVGLTEFPLSIGVAHGWTPITEPMKATEVDSNKVISINWESAYNVYKQIVEEHSGKNLNESNFKEIAKSYPLGLVKVDGEMVIRDPYTVVDGTLYLLDNIDSGQYFCIMHGNTESLIEGAREAKNNCINDFNENGIDGYYFCIDCFSRVKFLEDKFVAELDEIGGKDILHGALTFGEIANIGNSFLEIYNKTVIVAKWKQQII